MEEVDRMRDKWLEPEDATKEFREMSDDKLDEYIEEEIVYYTYDDLLYHLDINRRQEYDKQYEALLDEMKAEVRIIMKNELLTKGKW